MRKSRYNDISAYLFLLLVTVIAYWPVSSMAFSLKNDAINYFLAMRYNTSEAIQHGYFPSWSAYINMGYPLHADMQSGVWNPFVILMSLIRQYDIYWLHIETILVIQEQVVLASIDFDDLVQAGIEWSIQHQLIVLKLIMEWIGFIGIVSLYLNGRS